MKYRLSILVLLGILVFVYHVGVGLYHGGDLEPSPTFEFLYTSAFLCGVVWWLRADSREYQMTSVYCPGLLVALGWPILVPYHLFKTRGVRGFIPLLGFIGAFLVSYLMAALAYVGFRVLMGREYASDF